MSGRSAIEWTETTWNPTTGCDRISAGCDNCYALSLAKRLKAMGSAKYQNDGDPRTSGPGFGVATHEAALTAPLRWRQPRVVFVNSMSDLFHARVPTAFIARVFEVMAATPRHTYQVLTKRSVRVRRLAGQLPWPSNVWMGVSVEHSGVAGRIEDLRQVPAAVRFLSCEPLLGPLPGLDLGGIGWVIAGGESGPGARPAHPRWFTDLRDQCLAADVPFFFKQWGGATPKAGGRVLEGRTWDEMPPVHPVQLDHQQGVQNDHHGPPLVDHQRSVVRRVVRGVQPVQNDLVQPVQGVQSWTPGPDQVGHPDRTGLDTAGRAGGLRRALSPPDRALALAELQRRRTGALPTIRELAALAEVAHSTAATVLHELRQATTKPVPGSSGPHLVTDQSTEGTAT